SSRRRHTRSYGDWSSDVCSSDLDADLSKAIKAGAKGYLLKDAPRDELLACIRKVHSGETVIPPSLVTKLTAGLSAESVTDRELRSEERRVGKECRSRLRSEQLNE